MKKNVYSKDFDYYIDEYMYNCRSRKLRPKTMMSYEQTLRLFERWCLEEEKIAEPGQVVESTIRHYICSLQERGIQTQPHPVILPKKYVNYVISAKRVNILTMLKLKNF